MIEDTVLTFHYCSGEEPVAACGAERHMGFRLCVRRSDITCHRCKATAIELAKAEEVIAHVKSSQQRKRIDWDTRKLVPTELAKLTARLKP